MLVEYLKYIILLSKKNFGLTLILAFYMFCFLKLNQKFIIVNFVTNFWELTLMNDDYDILIIGSVPSGVSTWLHLNKYAPELALRTALI